MIDDTGAPGPPDKYDPERQREVLAKVARALAQRRLTSPAIFTLESTKPLSYLASQALVFFQPIIQALFGVKDYEVFSAALEDRDNIEWLIQRLEQYEEEEAEERRARRAHKRDASETGER